MKDSNATYQVGHMYPTPGSDWPAVRRQRPSFQLSDIWKAPLHDFPIRDEILYQFLSLSPEMDVLEIGPGSGFTAFRMARQVRRMTLVDVSAQALADLQKQFQELPNVDFTCADLSSPGLAHRLGRSFDAAFGLDVFEHVEGPATCLQNLGAVLRPGGCLLLSYPNTHPDKPHGVTRFSRKEDIAELLAEAGFSRWEIFPIRLRRSAAKIYDALHEWPIELHRRLRRNGPDGDPQIYEATWAFQQRQKLVRYKVPLHAFWVALGQTMRLGGDVFVAGPVTDEILGRQLVVRAWK